MPPISRRVPRARGDFELRHVCYALKGYWFFRGERLTADEVRPCWGSYASPLLAFHVAYEPGTRPWAWWQWDAPEPVEEEETQHAYLSRHRLWLPGEQARWQAGETRIWTISDLSAWWESKNGH